MKVGVRKPSIKRSFKARTTGKMKRKMKKAVNPFYGKKGMGYIKNPKKALYNKVYHKTTVSATQATKGVAALIVWIIKLPFLLIWWPFKLIISLFNGNKKERNYSTISQTKEAVHYSTFSEEPTYRGDYSKAVFLWAMQKPHTIKQHDEYARYLYYECGIDDPVSYHNQMIEEGYIGACPIEQALYALKVDELKEILTDAGLPVTGKKADLITRAIENIQPQVLREHCPVYYAATEDGKQFIEAHQAYVDQHLNKNNPTLEDNINEEVQILRCLECK